MRSRAAWICGLVALAAFDARAATVVVTVLGDAAGSCPSATLCTLRAAIAAANPGDSIVFDAALVYPATLQLVGTELNLNKSLTIVGPGAANLAVRAATARRVLALTAGDSVIEGLAFTDGLLVTPSGTNGPLGSGAGGQPAQLAEGGCIHMSAGTSLVLRRVALRTCEARAGNGGAGGSGPNSSPGGTGGPGGNGGSARGGAIAVLGQLTLIESSVQASTARAGGGGAGGRGGNGAGFSPGGNGGNGGASGGARGGAIYVASGGALIIRNSTLAANTVTTVIGGSGGAGGFGDMNFDGAGGNGGAGGSAFGGQLFLSTSLTFADIEFATLGPATVTNGPGGIPGAGAPSGQVGVTGFRGGEILSTTTTTPRVLSSSFVGTSSAADCEGTPGASGANADSDNTCAGFTLQGTFAATFRGPAFEVQNGRAVLLPLPASLVIDSASSCNDLAGATVVVDQNAGLRPLDGNLDGTSACDVGAIEFDTRIFSNGFEP